MLVEAPELRREERKPLVDQLDGLISHADGYPGWARLLFIVALALVALSCVVYAVEYTRLKHRSNETAPEGPTAQPSP